ncbi:hypothetical protein Tco_0642012 [Tanacetum coccineum]
MMTNCNSQQSYGLVEKGFCSGSGVLDFEESFAPVARLEAERFCCTTKTDSLSLIIRQSLPSKGKALFGIETSPEAWELNTNWLDLFTNAFPKKGFSISSGTALVYEMFGLPAELEVLTKESA